MDVRTRAGAGTARAGAGRPRARPAGGADYFFVAKVSTSTS